MKIYTRTGDRGETSLLKGGRVPKYHLRVQTYGTFDELNSWIGYIRAINRDAEVEAVLAALQPKLHILCSDIAARMESGKEALAASAADDRTPRIPAEAAGELESGIDRWDRDISELHHFILPGGTLAGAALHIARTVCRRGERLLAELDAAEGGVNPAALRFANRLSDYLFTLARWANQRAGCGETPWVGSAEASETPSAG
jgi:cob(I)alamin adenosyltransferase